jgi:hypothetical protein
MVMFVIAMTLVVLGSMGVYALQNASRDIRMTGFTRQAVQAHYATYYAVHAILDLLARDADGLLNRAASTKNQCKFAVAGNQANAVPCYRVTQDSSEFSGNSQTRWQKSTPSDWNGTSDNGLGRGETKPKVEIAMEVLAPTATTTASGMGNSQGLPLARCAITVHVRSTVTPSGATSESITSESAIATLISGPTICTPSNTNP